MRALLSPEEKERADRFRFPAPRQQFVTARATLRTLLGICSGVEPQAVPVATGRYGKPVLATGTLRFNLSHAGDLGLLAISADCEVGVDVERLCAKVEALRVAHRFFAPAERAALQNVEHTADLLPLFFRIWTRKEALLKGMGTGLTVPLNSFQVIASAESNMGQGPDSTPKVRSLHTDVSGWELTDVSPLPGYFGALAWERLSVPPRLFCWTTNLDLV